MDTEPDSVAESFDETVALQRGLDERETERVVLSDCESVCDVVLLKL